MSKKNVILGLVAVVGAAIALPQVGKADISVVPNNGLPSYALAETNGTFPTLLQGVTNGATLHLTPGLYDFIYTGNGDASNTNAFSLNGNTLSTAQPVLSNFFYLVPTALDLAFTFASSGGCSIRSGAIADACAYLVGVADPKTAYLGFSDAEPRTSNMPPPLPPLPDVVGRSDYQDLVIKVVQVPEPASMGLFGLGLLGLGMLHRRRAG